MGCEKKNTHTYCHTKRPNKEVILCATGHCDPYRHSVIDSQLKHMSAKVSQQLKKYKIKHAFVAGLSFIL